MIKRKTYSRQQVASMLRPFSDYATPELLDQLIDKCEVVEYARDTYIYKEGDVSRSVYCLFHGFVKIYLEVDGLSPQIVNILKGGDFFGYEAYIAEHNYATSCVAQAGAVVCSIPIDLIASVVETNPAIMHDILKHMTYTLFDSYYRYVRLTRKHMRGRLADVLLHFISRYGYEPDGATLAISLSREELADIANMTTANAIRTLSAFAAEGVLAVERRKIRVLSLDSLKEISMHN